jgi:hypothetical protein
MNEELEGLTVEELLQRITAIFERYINELLEDIRKAKIS